MGGITDFSWPEGNQGMGLLMEQSVATQNSQAEDLDLENKHPYYLTASTSFFHHKIMARLWKGKTRTL